MWKTVRVIFVAACVGLHVVRCDLRCYSCMMMGDAEQDAWCLTNPAVANIVNCPFNYCAIIRHEHADTIGALFAFYRGCSSGGQEGVTVTEGFKVYTRLCSQTLCNDWDGNDEMASQSNNDSGEQVILP